MPQSLSSRKHQLVHDAIYNAAIDLFCEKGFEQTTVEEIAEAAGVSRRSFFRYFASKDDLLAQNLIAFGEAQVASIEQCPPEMPPIQVVRTTVARVLEMVASQPRTRQVISVAKSSPLAMQAHMSHIKAVECKIGAAFAARIPNAGPEDALPHLLGGLTTLVMGVSLMSWFHNEFDSVQAASEAAFRNLSGLFSAE